MSRDMCSSIVKSPSTRAALLAEQCATSALIRSFKMCASTTIQLVTTCDQDFHSGRRAHAPTDTGTIQSQCYSGKSMRERSRTDNTPLIQYGCSPSSPPVGLPPLP
eukprot:3164834-Pyramimonas_sp.AAC.1